MTVFYYNFIVLLIRNMWYYITSTTARSLVVEIRAVESDADVEKGLIRGYKVTYMRSTDLVFIAYKSRVLTV